MVTSPHFYGGFDNPSFAISVQPQPGEGLADLILRAIFENGFHDLWIINRLLGKGDIKRGWGHSRFSRSDIDVEALAILLGTPNGVEDIERLMYRRGDRGVKFFGVEISGNELMATRRVSPLSLRNWPYAKAIWAIRSLSFDPHTKETLLDHCPECAAPLNFRLPVSIYHCVNCSTVDFRDNLQPKVEVEDLEGLDCVTSLIDPEPTKTFSIPRDIQCFTKGELFTLATTLARVIDIENPGKSRRPSPTPNSLSIAGRAILGWPQKFNDMIEKYALEKAPGRNHTIDNSLYGVSPELRMVVRKELATTLSSRTRHYKLTGSKKSFSKPVRFWSSPSIMEQAKNIGLPVAEVLALYQYGTIECPDHRYVDRLQLKAGASPLNLNSLEKVERPDENAIPLMDAVLGLKASRHPWASVIAKVLEGTIPAQIQSPIDINLLKSAYLSNTDAVRAICEQEKSKVDPDSTVNTREAIFYLRLGSAAIATLKREGFFPLGKITMAEVWKFQADFISASEIETRLKIAGIKPPNYFAIGIGIKRMGGMPILLDFPRYSREHGEKYLSAMISEG